MVQPAVHGPRAEKTRNAILEAAEALFAERGFEGARLEDIAARVGIRRASIVYYFRDKRELYDEVLSDVFRGLHDAIERVLKDGLPPAQRIDATIAAWVDYVGERPTTARLLLREAADASPGGGGILALAGPLAQLIRNEFFRRPDVKAAGFATIDPIHVASTIVGATVFFVAAMPGLLPERGLDPTRCDQLDAHKEELQRVVRRLLGA